MINILMPNNALKRPEIIKEYKISRRETWVLELLYEGLSNKAIAERLFITTATVKFHLTNIYKKFKVKSRLELSSKLRSLGFV